jgi:hypothetical protein
MNRVMTPPRWAITAAQTSRSAAAAASTSSGPCSSAMAARPSIEQANMVSSRRSGADRGAGPAGAADSRSAGAAGSEVAATTRAANL